VLDEIVILLTTHTRLSPTDVTGIGEALGVVRPDVEEDGQGGRRMKARARGVERELADRNAHSAGALITEPEDALAVADDDDLGAIEPALGEDLLDAMALRPADEEATRLAPLVAEVLAPLAHRRRVDDRQELFEMRAEQRVEEDLGAVLKTAQEEVLLERRSLRAERL